MEVNVANLTNKQKIDYWSKVVSKFRNSNLSVSEFSAKCNITPHQLSYWKTRIVEPRHVDLTSNHSFIEVKDKPIRNEQISLFINDAITINFNNPPSAKWISELINNMNVVNQ